MAKPESKVWLVIGIYDDNLGTWTGRAEAVEPLTAAGTVMTRLKKKKQALLVAVLDLTSRGCENRSPFRTATPYPRIAALILEHQRG